MHHRKEIRKLFAHLEPIIVQIEEHHLWLGGLQNEISKLFDLEN